ncbi:protein FAM124A [Pristis pectinata]|uniref:protein FAM124A n=1 Tax=Pristis pectinata TaxID=685728 RepID=UPI00223E0B49|nr:protein FAM124A [Pristis pectinata]
MERRGLEEDWGAEIGGSDFSCKSSTSSGLSLEDMLDPFLVTMHIITDPGGAAALQSAVDSLVTWINPSLRLFIASERGSSLPPGGRAGLDQPALAVIIFIREEWGQQVWRLHECFLNPPWQYHHTERVKGRILPYMPRNQDFFTLADHPILWAARQVHYGKEIVRLALYCSFDNFADTVRMYQLILRREASKRRLDAVFFTVYSSADVEIQLSLKRLPKGQRPTPSQSAVLEFRVHDVGCLVPLLPNPCSPISEKRWQTEDYDGNKLLLQVRDLSRSPWRQRGVPQFTRVRSNSFAPSCTLLPRCVGCVPERSAPCQPISHKPQLTRGLGRFCGRSQEDIWGGDQGDTNRRTSGTSRYPRSAQRSKSLFCLPTFTGSASSSLSSSPLGELALSLGERHRPTGVPARGLGSPVTVLDVDGAAETEVDTGLATSCSDLSVSTLDGLSHSLKAALPPLPRAGRKPVSDPFSSFSSVGDPLPPFCERPSSSSPQFREFSPSCLNHRTPSPRAPIMTSWLCHRARQSSSPVASSAARNKRCPENQQSSLPLDAEQEFYI